MFIEDVIQSTFSLIHSIKSVYEALSAAANTDQHNFNYCQPLTGQYSLNIHYFWLPYKFLMTKFSATQKKMNRFRATVCIHRCTIAPLFILSIWKCFSLSFENLQTLGSDVHLNSKFNEENKKNAPYHFPFDRFKFTVSFAYFPIQKEKITSQLHKSAY